MNKREFLEELKSALNGLPKDDVEERLAFYGEMIDDRVEEGDSEERAVAGIGSINDIVSQTVAEVPLTRIVKERIKPNRSLRAWEIVLLTIGFPLWFPLLVAAFSVLFSVYVVVLSLIVSLWAIEISFCAGALGGIASAGVQAVQGNVWQSVAMLGAGLFLIGLSVFTFFGCVAAVKCILNLTKKTLIGIKTLFVRKESAK